jgi:hypothetical protein
LINYHAKSDYAAAERDFSACHALLANSNFSMSMAPASQ